MFRLSIIGLFFLLANFYVPPAQAVQIANGVEYRTMSIGGAGAYGATTAHALIVDLTKAAVEPLIPSAGGYVLTKTDQAVRQINSQISSTSSMRVVAGVNGGFFDSSSGAIRNLSFVLARNGVHEVQVNTRDSRWYHIERRSHIRFFSHEVDIFRNSDPIYRPDTEFALGGAGYLLPKSQLALSIASEIPPDALIQRPRTMVGYDTAGTRLWIVVVGKIGSHPGVTLYELADFAQNIGLQKALALDGGGSSQMWIEGPGNVVNSTTSVLSHLIVWAN